MTPTPSFPMTWLARAAALALAAPALLAHAQDASQKLEKVEITGSSIKRLDGETALPVQTLRREEIAKSGVTTAAELLKNISAATANLGDGASITDNTGGQRGFNGANLRGVGVSSTLVLLNGRRLANFASPGDAAGVDLNSIPAGAIQRVEVLKDGASAIYGTDAIGGVINFITRTDYTGLDLSAYLSHTPEGGAGKRTFTASAGTGELKRDGYNLFATVDVQSLDPLRSTQRRFIQERPLVSTVPYYLSSRPYPGNIRLSSSSASRAEQLAAINAAGYTFNGKPYTQRTVNLFAPGCNPPASVYAPTQIGSEACGYDYMADTEIYPDANKRSLLTRGALDLNGHELFGELLVARADTRYVLSPNPTTLSGMSWSAINAFLPKPVNNARTFEIRFRATELGNRTNQVSSDANRLVLGAKGRLNERWDYSAAAALAENKVADRYVNGYFKYNELLQAVKDGRINPFGPSPAASKDLIQSLRVDDAARTSEGRTSSLDFKATGVLGELAGGEIGIALGAELRRESQSFTPSALLLSNNIGGDRDSSGSAPALQATHHARNIASGYAELNLPFSRTLELQAALRADHYEKVGSSVNPKLGVRYQPSKELVLRGSAGTGFRAPTFSELYRPTTYGTSPAFLYDAVYDAFDQYPTQKIANPNLKPEKSRQLSAGVAFEPVKDSLVSLDYWSIRKTDVISDLSGKIILENAARYAAYIQRDPFDGYPTLVLKKENQGGLKTSGLDLEARWRSASTAAGRFGLAFSGTYVLNYQRQFGKAEPFLENAGRFLQDQVIQRWRHRVSADWEVGPASLTLGNSHFSGHTDDSYLPDTQPRKVKAYSLWDVSGSFRFDRNVSVRAGVQNLFNTAPPFSNQSYYFLSTFDPTYTDPRGRNVFVSVNLKLR